MNTLTVLLMCALGFTFICTSNAVSVFGSRRRRSSVEKPRYLNYGAVKTPNVTPLTNGYGLNTTGRKCNDSSCPPFVIDGTNKTNVVLPNQNGTIIKQISGALNKTHYLCLAYDHTTPELRYYDPATQICCDGIFNRTRPDEHCCDGQIIDGDNETCCGGRPVPMSDTTGCCNGTVYDTNTTHCCKGITFPKTKISACCGDRVITEISEEKCCGDVSYVERNSVCCNKQVQPAIGQYNRHGSCCGVVSYDTRCFTCNVASVLVAIVNSTVNGTCCPGKVLNHNGREVCCVNGTTESVCQQLNATTTMTDTKASIRFLVSPVIACSYATTTMTDTKASIRVLVSAVIGSTSGLVTVFILVCAVVSLAFKMQAKDTAICGGTDESTLIEAHRYKLHAREPNAMRSESNDCYFNYSLLPNYDYPVVDVNVAGILNTLSKEELGHPGNQLTDHFIERECQTNTKDNAYNRRTVLGDLFERSALLDKAKPTFEMPDSEVRVRLPDSILTLYPVEMHGSSFGSLTAIMSKIRIASDEKLASPVVEYLLTGVPKMADHAVVTMPFVGKEADLRVWKFHSDDGMQTKVEPFEVPRKTKDNKDVSLYYEIQGNVVKIFTKSFSGFFVTEKKHNRDPCLSLHSFLFGSFKRIENTRYEVRLILYIADEIMKFEKYKEDMYKSEERGGRFVLREMGLTLTEQVRENDVLQAMVSVHSADWVHKPNPGMQTPILPETKVIEFRNLVSQCLECTNCHFQRRQIPFAMEWYLTNSPGTIPRDVFQCTVKVDCIRIDTRDVKQNELVVDELRLRAADRLPQEESSEAARLERLQDFLVNMEDDQKKRFIKDIKDKFDCTGDTLTEVFSVLHRTMRPVGIYEAVVVTLQRSQLYHQLSGLQDKRIVEDRYFRTPEQRTSGNESGQEQRQEAPGTSNYEITGQTHDLTEPPLGHDNQPLLPNDNGAHIRAENRSNLYHVTREYSTSRSADGVKVPGEFCLSKKADAKRKECRNELGSDLPVHSYLHEDDALVQNREKSLPERNHQSLAANGDSDDNLELTEVKHPFEQLHAQEQASLEETFIKRTTDSDSETEQN